MWTALFSVPIAFLLWIGGVVLVVALAKRQREDRPDEVNQLAVPFAGTAAAFVLAIIGVVFVVAVEIAFLLLFASRTR